MMSSPARKRLRRRRQRRQRRAIGRRPPSEMRRQLLRREELEQFPRLADGRRLVDGQAVYFTTCAGCGGRLVAESRPAPFNFCDGCAGGDLVAELVRVGLIERCPAA